MEPLKHAENLVSSPTTFLESTVFVHIICCSSISSFLVDLNEMHIQNVQVVIFDRMMAS